MTDGEVTSGELDLLDAVWDNLNVGRTNRAHAKYAADAATLRSLRALAEVPPPTGRRIWANAFARSAQLDHRARQGARAPGDRPMHLVAPAPSGWGWLPAGAIAVAASLAILGGIFFAGNDGDDTTRTHPGDASSVVATLASAAPAWATPGGEFAE